MADIFNFTDTWNSGATTFNAIKVDVTDSASAAASALLNLSVGGVVRITVGKAGNINFTDTAGNPRLANNGANLQVRSQTDTFTCPLNAFQFRSIDTGYFGWAGGGDPAAVADTTFFRSNVGVIAPRGASTTTAAAFEFYTYAASPPAAPGASMGRLYADTSGGKIRLMALFPSGAAQQVAIEP